jgi:hypothetical protein
LAPNAPNVMPPIPSSARGGLNLEPRHGPSLASFARL